MTSLWLANLLAYSLQLGALVGSGAFVAWAFRLHSPRARLRFWQSVAAAAVLLPALQSWRDGGNSTLVSSLAFATQALAPAGLASGWPGLPLMLAIVLASGVAVRFAWLALGLIGLRRFEAQSEAFTGASTFIDEFQRALGTTASVRISDCVDGPATIGAKRPLVLLPRRTLDLPDAIQRAIVYHELLHVRRHDWLQTLAEEACCAVFWFHPAARALASRLSLAREMLIDQETIAHTHDRRAYAEALLAFASARPAPLAAVAPLIRRRHLSQRLALVMQEVPMSRTRIALVLAGATVVVALTTAVAVNRFPISTTLGAQGADDTPFQAGNNGVTLPRVLTEVKPSYTPDAMQAKIQGSVMMSVVVLADGRVGDVTVTRSLDDEHGLDGQAVKAVRQWTFEPGTKDGKPVPVQVTVEMTFTLRK